MVQVSDIIVRHYQALTANYTFLVFLPVINGQNKWEIKWKIYEHLCQRNNFCWPRANYKKKQSHCDRQQHL